MNALKMVDSTYPQNIEADLRMKGAANLDIDISLTVLVATLTAIVLAIVISEKIWKGYSNLRKYLNRKTRISGIHTGLSSYYSYPRHYGFFRLLQLSTSIPVIIIIALAITISFLLFAF